MGILPPPGRALNREISDDSTETESKASISFRTAFVSSQRRLKRSPASGSSKSSNTHKVLTVAKVPVSVLERDR